MPALKGRSVIVRHNGAAIAGVRTKSISINGAPIDITSDDDAAVRNLMNEPGQVDVNISVSGVAISPTVLRNLALNTTDRVAEMQFNYDGSPGNNFQGQFFLASYKETGEYQGAVMFEAEFQSAGTITYA